MRGGVPPLRTHLALLAHDRSHGEGQARLGPTFHWLRTWLCQRHRQWSGVDAIVCGSNPILGALACAGLAQRGQTVLWLCPNDLDAWDYPLAIAGMHDDLLAAAGLPPMGAALFEALAARCAGRVSTAWGWTAGYVVDGSIAGAKRLAFASQTAGGRWGEARSLADAWKKTAFASVDAFAPKRLPSRMGPGLRQQVVEHGRAVWVSDALDGMARQGMGQGPSPERDDIRLGRARWHAQTPGEFAAQSRQDMEFALREGAWK